MSFLSVFTSSHIFLLAISLYRGAFVTQSITLSFNNFFYPAKTFLTKEVVMSRSEGQYLQNEFFEGKITVGLYELKNLSKPQY